jgi:hypothetical protein
VNQSAYPRGRAEWTKDNSAPASRSIRPSFVAVEGNKSIESHYPPADSLTRSGRGSRRRRTATTCYACDKAEPGMLDAFRLRISRARKSSGRRSGKRRASTHAPVSLIPRSGRPARQN